MNKFNIFVEATMMCVSILWAVEAAFLGMFFYSCSFATLSAFYFAALNWRFYKAKKGGK